jgi:hypothetical protein
MAGGGIKGGVVHATILRQLGLDSRRLEVPGRKRLEIDHGRPIHEIIA